MTTILPRLLLAFLLAAAPGAGAQDYPARPVRLLVGFPPGGNVDVVARIIAQKMSDGLGRSVVVETRAGAGGIIANELATRATPDGYTLLMVSGAHVTQAATQKKLPYDALRDFRWISTLVSYPIVIVVRAESRFRTLDELIAHVKSNPRKFDYPTPGMGTVYHLTGEMLNAMAGIEMNAVPFRGGAEPINELLSGRMEMLMDALTNAYPYIQSGRFRPLAVSSLERSPVLPNVPTVAQSVPGYEATSFLGIAAPRETPAVVVERLNREIRRILDLPDISQRFSEMGGTPRASSPAEMERFVENEIAKWKRVVEARKIELQ
ncbi:MAG TPA: tripartite tricarboxylate transporter substrate binding protein [Burkholderiales bacterium]|nr:tripartite tricarboxylate transporter substrate binding protein [Burkholderiales bacterium]